MKKTFLLILAAVAVILASFHAIGIYRTNKAYENRFNAEGEVALRKHSYPYKATLAISNDIDGTSTVEEFLTIHKFLNTMDETEIGRGLGLEIANSFYMFEPDEGGFSYFSKNPYDRIVIREFARAGYLDTFHSWGEEYKGRADALQALEELRNHGLHIRVWTGHYISYSDLGRWSKNDPDDIQLGDNPDSKYYHSDLTLPYGIRFIWAGDSTSIPAQGSPISPDLYFDLYDPEHPLMSLTNVGKSLAKHLLATFGFLEDRYSLHAQNELVGVATLDDGQKVFKFMRFDSHPEGIGFGANADTMAYNLSERILNHLTKAEGFAVLYTHLGKGNPDSGIPSVTRDALRYLQHRHGNGEINVVTTYRLLTYYVNHKYLNWSFHVGGDMVSIDINSIDDPVSGPFVPDLEQLQGLTFYVPSGKKARIRIQGEEISDLTRNPPDETMRESVTIPLVPLQFPDLLVSR